MSQKHVTARVPEDLFDELERVQKEERTDRSTAVKRLLERGLRDWRTETAVERYRAGEYSLGRAAEFAGVSLWRFLDLLDERGIETNYTESDLASDLATAREE